MQVSDTYTTTGGPTVDITLTVRECFALVDAADTGALFPWEVAYGRGEVEHGTYGAMYRMHGHAGDRPCTFIQRVPLKRLGTLQAVIAASSV